jgi:hypothetical protein
LFPIIFLKKKNTKNETNIIVIMIIILLLLLTSFVNSQNSTCELVQHNYPHLPNGSIYIGFKLWGKAEQCCNDCSNTQGCDYVLFHAKVCLKYQYYKDSSFSDVQLKPFVSYTAGFVKK